jgi:hypothetical protein
MSLARGLGGSRRKRPRNTPGCASGGCGHLPPRRIDRFQRERPLSRRPPLELMSCGHSLHGSIIVLARAWLHPHVSMWGETPPADRLRRAFPWP